MKKKSLVLVVITGMLITIAWWQLFPRNSENHEKIPAATVQKIVKEEDFNTITLSEKTAQLLGIKTELITMKSVGRTRLYGGEIMTPVGRNGEVTAPVAGLLRAPAEGSFKDGDKVKKGQPIFILLPLLTVEAKSATATAQVDADMQVKNAATQLEAAKIALHRAQILFADGVGAKRMIDEAQSTYDTAKKTLEAAKDRQHLLEDSLNEGTAAPMLITAPQDGVIRKISNAHSQNVLAGAMLFALGDASTAWVRVTIPVTDMEDIARDGEAHIGSLSAQASQPMQSATPVSAPPIANAQTYTVDMLYMLHDSSREMIPAKRVGVMLPLNNTNGNDTKESLTIPASAIVFDALGGSWAYEQTAALNYVRKRVTVNYIHGSDAVLLHAPSAGTMIVTRGAEALFGAETGTMK